jgi:hypothetical protein
MNRYILLPILLFNIYLLNAQTLTLSEMIDKTKYSTFTEFNNFAVKKGFNFRKLDTLCCNGHLYNFTSERYVDSLKDGYVYSTQCQFFIGVGHNGKEKNVAFITRSNKNYEPFITQLSALKFKVDSQTPSARGEGMFIIYKSPSYTNIEVRISISIAQDSESNNYTLYSVTVARIG